MNRWIKEVLASTGIDVNIFSAHFTRRTAASTAFATGSPLERILKAGGWAAQSVNSKHYQRPVNEPELDRLGTIN